VVVERAEIIGDLVGDLVWGVDLDVRRPVGAAWCAQPGDAGGHRDHA
jgi:hypothetical protein